MNYQSGNIIDINGNQEAMAELLGIHIQGSFNHCRLPIQD